VLGTSPGVTVDQTRRCPYCAHQITAEAVFCPFCGSDLSDSSSKAQAENQSEKKRGLSGLEISGLVIVVLAFLWLLWLCGLPPNNATQWIDWFFQKHGSIVSSPMRFLFLFCALWWLLVLRRTKH